MRDIKSIRRRERASKRVRKKKREGLKERYSERARGTKRKKESSYIKREGVL